jgi:hypothetical protein
MTTAILNATPNSLPLCPEHVTVRFNGINFNLLKMSDAEFQGFYDRVLDDSLDFSERLENMSASQFIEHKNWIQRQQAQNAYNLELLEVEEKRRITIKGLEAN